MSRAGIHVVAVGKRSAVVAAAAPGAAAYAAPPSHARAAPAAASARDGDALMASPSSAAARTPIPSPGGALGHPMATSPSGSDSGGDAPVEVVPPPLNAAVAATIDAVWRRARARVCLCVCVCVCE